MAQNRKTGPGKNANVVAASKDSKKTFYIGLAAAAVIGVAALAYFTNQSAKTRIITVDPNLPAVTSQGYVMGSPDAKIELVEHGDFECPGCGQYAELTEPEIRQAYVATGKIRFRFIDFPLAGHRNTLNASNAAACADEQGKFWEMHDLIYGTQYQWSALINGAESADPDKHFRAVARQINGLDAAKFDECLASRRNLAKIQAHLKLGEDRGVRGTPTFFLGNQQFGGMATPQLKSLLDAALAAADGVQDDQNNETDHAEKAMTRRMWLAALAMVGMFIAAYLTLYHYGYIGSLACTGDGKGCETVQASRYSRMWGLPVAAWGLGYYLTVFALAIAGMQERFAQSRGFSTFLVAMTGWGALFSGWLTYLEAGPIGAWCQWCIGSATVATLLFVVSFLDWRATRNTEIPTRA